VLWLSSPRPDAFQTSLSYELRLVLAPWTADELVTCWKAKCAPIIDLESDIAKSARDVRDDVYEFGAYYEDNSNNDDDDKNINNMSQHAEREEQVLRRWIADLGPVARRVFFPVIAYARLNAAIHDMSNMDMENLVRLAKYGEKGSKSSGETSKFSLSHRLLLMIPSDDLTTYEFIPSSVNIGRDIIRLSQEKDIMKAKSLMGSQQRSCV